ncbi:MAG TPA: hypothetical protein VHT05_09655 [Candidatus Elarobacter sp.]|nr:hypothetical protein [Candidatus Elarobacter sp.]
MDAVRTIAQTVLYEGYLLWPYRRSAAKNQHRFTIGGLLPAAYAASVCDRARARFDALVEGNDPRFDVEVRFLRLRHRQVLRNGEPVDTLIAGEREYLTWDEATEEAVTRDDIAARATPLTVPIAFAATSDDEVLGGGNALRRTALALTGHVDVSCAPMRAGLGRLRIEVANDDAWPGTDRDGALRRALLACHVVVRVRGGAFVSVIDPPDELRDAAATCSNDGLWPVLVGEAPDRSTLFAAPMILEDYPWVAPESRGDYFDGGEVDELLVHSIRALTDAEQREIRATDPRAAELLDRTLALTDAELARLHGAQRPVAR